MATHEPPYLGAAGRMRVALVLFVAMALQLTVASRFSLFGVHPDLMILTAVAAGAVSGPGRGATLGFCAGLLNDLFNQAPVGLSALAFCLVGYAVGSVHSTVLQSTRLAPPATAFIASAGGEVLYALIGAIVGQSQMISGRLPLVASVVALINGLLAPLAVRALTWAGRAPGQAAPPRSRW